MLSADTNMNQTLDVVLPSVAQFVVKRTTSIGHDHEKTPRAFFNMVDLTLRLCTVCSKRVIEVWIEQVNKLCHFISGKQSWLPAREIFDHQKWTWWKLGGHTVRSACFLLRSRACWAYHVAPFATTLAQAVKYSRKTGERAGSRLEPTLVHKSTHCKPYKLLGWCYHAKVVKQSKLEYHTFHVIHTIFATTTTQESWCDIWNCLPKPVVGPSDHHWALTNWSHFCSILLKPLLPEVWKRI